jgi:hypothetical protein
VTKRPAFIALIAVIAAWIWMFLTVHYNYSGNWTALYLIGPRTPVPPGIPAERLYIFPNNTGYDGQSFHVMAHDPWMRRSTPAEVEIEPFRYARILVPAIAWMLVLGHDPWIEPAYFTTILAFVFLGVYWMAMFALRLQLHPAWGLTFLLSPATLTSLDRMTVDVALAALCVALVLCYDPANGEKASRWRVIVILALMLLTRETAWFIFGACEVFLLMRRRFSDAEVIATAAIPVIAWHVFLVIRTGEIALPPRGLGWTPFAGFFERLTHPAVYDLPANLAKFAIGLDYVALCGMALAVIVGIRIALREPSSALTFTIFGFCVAVIFLPGQGEWGDAFAFGRIFAPLLLLIAMFCMPGRSWRRIGLGFAPTILVDSRIALNLGKHALDVGRELLHWA